MSLSLLNPENNLLKNLIDDLVGGLVGGLPGLPTDPSDPALPDGEVVQDVVEDVVGGVTDLLGGSEEDPVLPGTLDDLLGVPSYSEALENLIDELGLIQTGDIEAVLADLLPKVSELLNLSNLGDAVEDALGGGGDIPGGEELQPVFDLLTDITQSSTGLLRNLLLGTVEFTQEDGLALVDSLLSDVYQLIDEITGSLNNGEFESLDVFASLTDFLEGVAGSLETFVTALTNLEVINPEDLQPVMEIVAVVQQVGDEVVNGLAGTGLIPDLGDWPGTGDGDGGNGGDNGGSGNGDGGGSGNGDGGVVSDDSPLVGDEGVLNFNTIMLNGDGPARGTEEEDHFVYHQAGDALILDFDAAGGDKLVFDTGYDFDSVDDILPFLLSAEFLQNDIVNLDFGQYGLISIVGLATQDASWDLVQVLS